MIHVLTLRDLILIKKLKGVVLPREEALVDGYSPLQAALLSSLNPFRLGFRQAITYVLSQQGDHRLVGIAQVQENIHRTTSQVIYLAPDKGWEDPTIWARWLEDICQKAGERGMKRILACLPAQSDRLSAFQQAGFRIYAHEDLFQLTTPSAIPGAAEGEFRPRRAEDAWGLAKLYNAITPPVVQQAEGLSQIGPSEAICKPTASHRTQGYVLEVEQEILGYAEMRCGSRGAWVCFLLHPQAKEMAETLVRGALRCLPHRRIYCSLPDYQGGMRAALRGVGFELFGRQTLLVRYVAVFARKPIPALVSSLRKGAEVIAPVSRANKNRPEPSRPQEITPT
ncbi:MAG: hypothetical protein U9Q78_00855 [Chloroflexota bacterium]|nr:hypothetical protein [Chloroflexota bacterium]